MDEGFNKMMISRAKVPKDEDFMEEDIWPVNFMKDREGSSFKAKRAQEFSSTPACRIPVPKVIPRVNSGSKHRSSRTHQSSTPVNIPDWSKIYSQKKSNMGSENDGAWAAASNGNGASRFYTGNAVDDDDDEDSDMLPPHEFIARRLARNPVVSYSMCEGIGRTLKGRDLSKLRNAILTKTGFIE